MNLVAVNLRWVLLFEPFTRKDAAFKLEARGIAVVFEHFRVPAVEKRRCLKISSRVLIDFASPGKVETALKISLIAFPGFLNRIHEF